MGVSVPWLPPGRCRILRSGRSDMTFSWSSTMDCITASGRGGQPGM